MQKQLCVHCGESLSYKAGRFSHDVSDDSHDPYPADGGAMQKVQGNMLLFGVPSGIEFNDRRH